MNDNAICECIVGWQVPVSIDDVNTIPGAR